jgi:formamidopyrimidine-DNA glycosylase
MPELPDVEVFRRSFARRALHQKIESAEVDASRMLKGVSARQLKGTLGGATFASTQRHGKYLLAELRRDCWLILHFGMTGYLDYGKTDNTDWRAPKHTHLLIRFSNGDALAVVWQRMLGRISLAESPASFAEEEDLGPDALALKLGPFKQMFDGKRGTIKSALMDQSFIAGIGNIYGDEMLFQAGIHPELEAGALDEEQLTELHRGLRHVLKIAIERQADPERMPDTWLLLHRNAGEICPRCGGKIETLKVSGRTAYLCPKCQRRAR